MRKKVLEEFGNLESKTVGLLHDMEFSNGHLLSESLLAPTFQASNTENSIDGTEANASSSFTLIGFVNFENAGFGLAACVPLCEDV